jgi:hypothetical protein
MLAYMPGAAEKAASRAINKAVNSAKAEVMRQTSDRYMIGAPELRKSIKIIGATSKRLQAKLISTSHLYPITKFKFKDNGGKVTTEIVASETKPWKSAFIATVTGPYAGSHLGVFVRTGVFKPAAKASNGAGGGSYYGRKSSRNGRRSKKGGPVLREQIREKFSVSSAEMIGYPKIIDAVLLLAEARLKDELDRQIELFLNGKAS